MLLDDIPDLGLSPFQLLTTLPSMAYMALPPPPGVAPNFFCFPLFLMFIVPPVTPLLSFLSPSFLDWTVNTTSLIDISPKAEIYEDTIDFRMGPFKTFMEAVQEETVVFSYTSYSDWCSPSASSFDNPSAHHLCGLLHSVRATGVVTAILGGATFLLYCILAFRSLKGQYIAKTARVSMVLHIVQAGCAFATVGLWMALTKAYHSSLTSALDPEFASFRLPYGRSFYRVVVVGILALVSAAALHIMAAKSVGAIEKQATIERKRSEFELREAAESARRQAEQELRAENMI